jgi:hypothetical protein
MKEFKSHKFDSKGKNKNKGFHQYDEEYLTLKEIKRDKQQKKFRNYENNLRSKNIDALMEYDEN